jgi:hypothetical protein
MARRRLLTSKRPVAKRQAVGLSNFGRRIVKLNSLTGFTRQSMPAAASLYQSGGIHVHIHCRSRRAQDVPRTNHRAPYFKYPQARALLPSFLCVQGRHRRHRRLGPRRIPRRNAGLGSAAVLMMSFGQLRVKAGHFKSASVRPAIPGERKFGFDLGKSGTCREPTFRVHRSERPHEVSSSSNALASFKSSVSKPSVNQP